MKCFSKNSRIIFQKWNSKYDSQAAIIQGKVFSKFVDIDIMTGFNEKLQIESEQNNHPLKTVFNANYSFCAVNEETGRLIAGIKNNLWEPEYDEEADSPITETSHPADIVFRILSDIDRKWPAHFKKMGIQPNSKEVLNCLIGFTDEGHMNNGLYSELYKFAEDSAKDAGIKYIYRVLASKPIQNLMINRFKFNVVEEIYLRDIQIEGFFPCLKYIRLNPSKIDSKFILAFKEL